MSHIEHHFVVEEAVKCKKIEKAILLYNIRYWLEKNKANKKNIHQHENGKYYYFTFNSGEAFGNLFPYMSARSINRWLFEMETDGILISGIFNKTKYDKTKWYSIKNEYETQDCQCISQIGVSISQHDESISQIGPPIPDNKPDNKPNNKTILFKTPKNDNREQIVLTDQLFALSEDKTETAHESLNGPVEHQEVGRLDKKEDLLPNKKKMNKNDFITFWQAYPRHDAKKIAETRFLKLNKDKLPIILEAIENQKRGKQWQDIQFIPQPSTWLNQERWEDEIITNKPKKDNFYKVLKKEDGTFVLTEEGDKVMDYKFTFESYVKKGEDPIDVAYRLVEDCKNFGYENYKEMALDKFTCLYRAPGPRYIDETANIFGTFDFLV